jgi:hypothetical protein
MKNVTEKFLTDRNACSEGMAWVRDHKLIGLESKQFLAGLIASEKLDWANWLIVRVMTKKQYVAYAIFAAEQVIEIYEKKYPDDKRPRLAIEAAKNYLNNPSAKNKKAVADAAAAAYAAADAAYAAYAAAYAAYADAAAYTAYAAAYAAYAAAKKEMKLRILKYGLGLLK